MVVLIEGVVHVLVKVVELDELVELVEAAVWVEVVVLTCQIKRKAIELYFPVVQFTTL